MIASARQRLIAQRRVRRVRKLIRLTFEDVLAMPEPVLRRAVGPALWQAYTCLLNADDALDHGWWVP